MLNIRVQKKRKQPKPENNHRQRPPSCRGHTRSALPQASAKDQRRAGHLQRENHPISLALPAHKDNQEKVAHIDLLINRKDNTINLCEIKFANSEFVIDAKYAAELRSKIQTFRTITTTRKNVFLTLITPFGLAKNQYATELVAGEVTMEGVVLRQERDWLLLS
jgi:hypothetical protein